MQIGVCDDQKEIRETIADKVRRLYPAEDIRAYLINFNFVRKYDATTIYLKRGQAVQREER